jgi:hypothetical protein
LNFETPYPFSSEKCHHDSGDRYFLFKFLDKPYYAVVREVYAGSHGYYALWLSDNKIILDNFPAANYDLYVYDYDQNPIGNSQLGNGTEDIVTIIPPSPQPIPAPSISKVNPPLPEFPFALLTLIIATFAVVLISRMKHK